MTDNEIQQLISFLNNRKNCLLIYNNDGSNPNFPSKYVVWDIVDDIPGSYIAWIGDNSEYVKLLDEDYKSFKFYKEMENYDSQ